MNNSNKNLEDLYTTESNGDKSSFNNGETNNYNLDFLYNPTTMPDMDLLDQIAPFQSENSIEQQYIATPYDLNQSENELFLNSQDASNLMSTFNSEFYTQQSTRQEQDIFAELIDLASTTKQPKSIQTVEDNNLDRFYQSSDSKVNSSEKLVYDLKIIQQPSRARMCGFGDKDRRPIVPAPILQLSVTDNEGNSVNPEDFDVTFLVVLCDSCLQTGEPANSATTVSKKSNSVPVSQVVVFSSSEENRNSKTSRLKNLVGSSVVSANKLYGVDNELGIFFIFHDISLRTEGVFRLKFSLVDVGLPNTHRVNTNELSHVIKIIYSDPFTVYTAKKYPGVVQASPLSICFAQQGIKIPVRKDPSGLKNKQKPSGWLYNDEK